ncbi:MAG: ribosome maturation factor RimM [Tannerellaceae bacterium]|jgi:16S rRNA processing protein RimM|nr:ribosome maturation factor RimM [Tannerellaceae bacterium]
MIEKDTVRKIGYFTKPHGIKGEIGMVLSYDIFSHTDDPFIICETEGILVPFFIEEHRNKTSSVVLVKLETVNSEEDVRAFSNLDVYCPLRDIEEEETDGQASKGGPADYIGYTVSDATYGPLGAIESIDDSTANVLFRIDNGGRELLIPVVEEWIISVSHKEKRLDMSVPDGLLDL